MFVYVRLSYRELPPGRAWVHMDDVAVLRERVNALEAALETQQAKVRSTHALRVPRPRLVCCRVLASRPVGPWRLLARRSAAASDTRCTHMLTHGRRRLKPHSSTRSRRARGWSSVTRRCQMSTRRRVYVAWLCGERTTLSSPCGLYRCSPSGSGSRRSWRRRALRWRGAVRRARARTRRDWRLRLRLNA